MFWGNLVLLLPRRMAWSCCLGEGVGGETKSLQQGKPQMNLAVASSGHGTEDLCPFISFEQTRSKGTVLGWVSAKYHRGRAKS